MTKALLIVPPFWDPVCVPLGVSSLKAYAEMFGHQVELFDFNTEPQVFAAQRAYFEEGKRQFPVWRKWNIERNGTEMLALHQIIYLYARKRARYPELVAEVLNMNDQRVEEFMDKLDSSRFDEIFHSLYTRVSALLEKLLFEIQPDVVGCSLFNSTWPASLFVLRRVKTLMPQVRTVVGGPGPIMGITSRHEEVQSFFDAHDFIDYFVIGEGEQQFLQLLNHPEIPRGIIDSRVGQSLDSLKSTALRMKDMPLPNYGNLQIDKYLQLSIASSRGCPFECSFCAETVFWKGFRVLDKSLMFDQMERLAQKYGRDSFYICDSLSNQIISPLTERVAASGKPYLLDCYLRADVICTEEKRTRKWREGGLFRARLGLESGSQRILDAMVKMTNPDNMEKSLSALAGQGIMTSTLWIVCYPGETEAEFEMTLDFIRRNRRHIYQSDAWLFQYHPEGLAHGKEIDEERGTRHRFSSDLNKLFALTPYVVDNDFSPAERFDRLERFVAEMKALQIPNPYSLYEWLAAENRWNELEHSTGTGINNMLAINA